MAVRIRSRQAWRRQARRRSSSATTRSSIPISPSLLAIAQEIGRVTGATVGVLPDGANAVGAHLAGAVPGKGGLDARAMIDVAAHEATSSPASRPSSTWARKPLAALAQAEFGVVLSAYRNATTEAPT